MASRKNRGHIRILHRTIRMFVYFPIYVAIVASITLVLILVVHPIKGG